MIRYVTAVVGAAVAFAGCGAEETTPSRDADSDAYKRAVDVTGTYIVDYCTYGAVSVKQLSGCIYHVAADDIEPLDTPAASYAATGQGAAECGRDAGSFCGPGEKQDRALEKALELP
jgi:hypothetical protein